MSTDVKGVTENEVKRVTITHSTELTFGSYYNVEQIFFFPLVIFFCTRYILFCLQISNKPQMPSIFRLLYWSSAVLIGLLSLSIEREFLNCKKPDHWRDDDLIPRYILFMANLARGQIVIHLFGLGAVRLFSGVAKKFMSLIGGRFQLVVNVCTTMIAGVVVVHLYVLNEMLNRFVPLPTDQGFWLTMTSIIFKEIIVLVALVIVLTARVFSVQLGISGKVFVPNLELEKQLTKQTS